jgi:hypothetical protein
MFNEWMMPARRSYVRMPLSVVFVLVGAYALPTRMPAARAQSSEPVPTFTLDATWPKPLPNNWVLGMVASLDVDSRDHVWIIHRARAVDASSLEPRQKAAPPVIEFDRDGHVLQAWGGPGPGYDWMEENLSDYPRGSPAEHGVHVDHKDNVWVTGNGDQVLKFTRTGKFLMAIGQHFKTGGSNNTNLLGNPTDVAVDPTTNEVFIADGYLNRRVVVFDADTGQYKRHWGAYGKRPDDGPAVAYEPDKPLPQQFFIVHGLALSKDGFVYVCDRQRNRLQVFHKGGTFVSEVVIAKETPAGAGITRKGPLSSGVTRAGLGSVFRVGLSTDRAERYVYVLSSGQVHILRRSDLEVLGSFAANGNHGVAADSQGNVYTSGSPMPAKYVLMRTSK